MKQTDFLTRVFRSVKKYHRKLSVATLFLAGTISTPLTGQVTYNFITAGATGTAGPTQAQVTATYAATNLNGNVTVSGLGIQQWVVPTTALYRIETYGAEGGTSAGTNAGAAGGQGAIMIGDFNLTAGQVLSIVVGQKGGGSNSGGGGGGGSYVIAPGNIPLCVAGGGGGATGSGTSASLANGYPGLITTTGGNSNVMGGPTYGVPATGSGGGLAGFGGTNGYGGGSGVGAGGAGVLGDGAPGGTVGSPTYNGGGKAFVNGSAGGWGSPILNSGGFGGGGGTWASAGYGGGGGGYSGGGGGSLVGNTGNGGGGGSFNSGTNQSNTAGANLGDGKVVITKLCNLEITATSTLICTGTTVTLTTNSVGTYTWNNGATNTLNIVDTPTTTTSYSVTGEGTVPAGCITTAVITITVNNTPTVTINSSTTSACQGQTVALTASGANTYTWDNGVTNGVAFTPLATTLYTVAGTNACGTSTAGITVTISSLPVTAATTTSLICAGSPATLTTGGATTYTWLPGSSTSTSYVVAPSAATIYTVTGKTGNCQGTATLLVNTNPLPSMTITTAGTAVCYGNSTVLNITGNATSYTWSVNGQTIPSIVVTPTSTTVYSIIGINGFNCVKTISQIIQVNQNPVVNVFVSNPEVCSGGSSTLTASGTNSYSWGGGITTSTNVVNPTATSFYNVTGTNTLTGCFTVTTASVSVYEPEIAVTSNTVICKGTNVVIGASGALTYTWVNNGSSAQNISVSPSVTTNYTVSGTVLNITTGVACAASNTIDVTVNDLPAITASSHTSTICRGSNATLTASGAGATGTYTWASNFGNTAVISVNPVLTQNYSVTGTDINGCKGTASVQVVVVTCTATGIAGVEADKDQLLIFPNPSSGEVTIASEQPVQLKLINELGQEVQVINITGTEKKTTLKNLTSGVYFLIGENGNIKQKIIVAN